MKLNQYSDAELLETYAPVLRFSGGEKFFPMKVTDFVRGCAYLKRKTGGREVSVAEWNKTTDAKTRLDLLASYNGKATYMQFVERRSRRENVDRVLLFLEVLFFVVVIIAGIIELHILMPDKIPLEYFDRAKMIVLGSLICVWPRIDADGKVHLAFLLNLFGIFFFGTIFGFGLAMLALALVVGFVFVYLVFFLGSRNEGDIPEYRIPALNIVNLVLISISSGIVGYLLGLWLGGARGISLITGMLAFIFYALLMIGKTTEDKVAEERITKAGKTIRLLLLMVLFVVAFPWLAFKIQLFDITYAIAFAIALSGVSLLWYALDPFSPLKPGLLLEENERKNVLGWDLRALVIIAFVLLLNAVMSYFIYSFIDTRYIGNIITASILHFSFSVVNLVLTIGLLGTRVASYFLDLFSDLNRIDVAKAKRKYDGLVSERKAMTDPDQKKPYWYYGRVCRDGNWVILQYNYFYAFNDFRTSAGGMNDHEGDWENVTVYVPESSDEPPCECNDRPHIIPFGVAYSQHYNGEFRFWENVKKVKDIGERETCHPLAYAALGSHANYPAPDIYDPSAQFSGITQRFVATLEKVIQQFRTSSRLVEKYSREIENAANQYSKDGKIAQGGGYDVGSREFAAGDGLRIGYKTPATDYDKESRVAVYLPEQIKFRESNFNGEPDSARGITFEDWAFEIINDEKPEWVNFKGMWGRKTNVEGENGPQGPKWDARGGTRIRWGKSEGTNAQKIEEEKDQKNRYNLEWMEVLLLDVIRDDNKPAKLRKQALQQITSSLVRD